MHPREAFLDRLRKLGASPDELRAVAESWDDPDGWEIPKAQLLALPDTQLRALIVGARDEYRMHTTTEEDDAEEAAQAALDRYTKAEAEYAELLSHLNGHPLKIGDVREWVGTDLDRVSVAREWEHRQTEPRKTLVAYLDGLLLPD